MAKGSSKDIGRAKCSSNFTDLAVSIFAVMCVSESFFFLAKLSHGLSRLRKSQSTEFGFFCKWCVLVLETKHLELAFRTLWTWSLDLVIEEVKMSRSHRKALVSASRSLAFTIHHRSRKSKELINPVWSDFDRLIWCAMNRSDLGSPNLIPITPKKATVNL